jgi:cellulose synthase/poly-beta-1,6-N-acetylglucosamine synthase-like glycosyltransferase
MSPEMRRLITGAGVDVTVVLHAGAGQEALADLVAALKTQEVPFVREIVALDSGWPESTRAMLKAGGVRVVDMERGKPFLRQAMKAAAGDVLVLVSQDTVPLSPGWLYGLATPLLDDVGIGMSSGRLIADAAVPPYQRGIITARPYLSGKQRIVFESASGGPGALFVPATNCALSRRAWRRAGEVEQVGADLAGKLYAAGFRRVYLPAPAAVVRSGELVGEFVARQTAGESDRSVPLFKAVVRRLAMLGRELVELNAHGDLASGERGEAYAVSFALHGARLVQAVQARATSPLRNLRDRKG